MEGNLVGGDSGTRFTWDWGRLDTQANSEVFLPWKSLKAFVEGSDVMKPMFKDSGVINSVSN